MYKSIDELVERIDERNSDGKISTLIGVSIDKCFINSVANINGTDLTKYKIIRRDDFAVSLMQVSRDSKIPIARLKDYDQAIMSPAYPIFRVRDTSVILPEYLEMWFMRPEFDTQRKVEAYFADKPDAESQDIKEKLYALISDVLFIPDRDNPEMYHPRIAVQNDYIFKQLREQDQEAFNHLYNHYYYQRHNEFWYHEAMKKLPVLTQATSMLVCGEDLGMVPDCVPWVMNQLQILSLEIQRMPKSPAHEFGQVHEYPFQSVCTIGTHDMSTFRGWWEEDKELTERFYHQELGHWGNVPEHAPEWLCEEVIRQHLESPSMLCILTWQDWTSMDSTLRNPDINIERINVPADPRHYWRWRMHITLEELMKQDEFNEYIRSMIEESGRSVSEQTEEAE